MLKPTHPITLLGDYSTGGYYILRIQVEESLEIPFGRFKRSKLISIPTGEYLYIGSAMKGLGPRLVRHASRSGGKPPHTIRTRMANLFPALELVKGSFVPPKSKTLYWNVDYLLDQETVHLVHVFIIGTATQLEAALGQFLEKQPVTSVIEKGLGANDIPGNTNLLRVNADDIWWHSLKDRLDKFLQTQIEPMN